MSWRTIEQGDHTRLFRLHETQFGTLAIARAAHAIDGDGADHARSAALDHSGRPLGRARRDIEIERLRRTDLVAQAAKTIISWSSGPRHVMHPHLAIPMGDPAGIGPEIIIKACE